MCRIFHTSWPVQNIGHLLHGGSLALASHVLRYGFLTMRGSTGGVSVEASVVVPLNSDQATAAAVVMKKRIVTMASKCGGEGRRKETSISSHRTEGVWR